MTAIFGFICRGKHFGENQLALKEVFTMQPGNHPLPPSTVVFTQRELHLDVCLLATQPAMKEPFGKAMDHGRRGKEWEVSKLGVQSFTISKFYIHP